MRELDGYAAFEAAREASRLALEDRLASLPPGPDWTPEALARLRLLVFGWTEQQEEEVYHTAERFRPDAANPTRLLLAIAGPRANAERNPAILWRICHGETMASIGRDLGLTRGAVSSVRNILLRQLRHPRNRRYIWSRGSGSIWT